MLLYCNLLIIYVQQQHSCIDFLLKEPIVFGEPQSFHVQLK